MDKGALQEYGILQLTSQMPSCGRGTLLSIIIQFKNYYMYIGKDLMDNKSPPLTQFYNPFITILRVAAEQDIPILINLSNRNIFLHDFLGSCTAL